MNTAADFFNAKVKAFRATTKAVKDTSFNFQTH